MNRVQSALNGNGWRVAPRPRGPEAAKPRS